MSTRKAGARWGEARVAFRLIASQVLAELQLGRTVRSVYEEMQPRFPAGYAQFAKYVQRYAARTEVRGSALSPPAPRSPALVEDATQGPRRSVLGPPTRRFALHENMTPEELDEYLIGPRHNGTQAEPGSPGVRPRPEDLRSRG